MYFDILDRFFEKPFAEMQKHGLNPVDVANDLASNEKFVKAFESDADEFVSLIREFWHDYGPVVSAHLRRLEALKSVFGGDMFPSYVTNIACSVGLYVDTIVLPDPLMSLADFVGKMRAEKLLYFIFQACAQCLEVQGTRVGGSRASNCRHCPADFAFRHVVSNISSDLR